MTVTLDITLWNTGDMVITVVDIRVDSGRLPVEEFTPVNINPGYTYKHSYTVILNPETGETRIEYNPDWDSGTSHVVFITYRVLGTKVDQEVSYNARVM